MENKHVLVVDNEPELLELLELNLHKAGLRVTKAQSGLAALELLQKFTFDLVILDIIMDELDGFAVLEHIRNASLEMPVILLSAKSDVESKIQGLGIGADDYVTKPFSIAELVARVQAHLRRASKATPIAHGIAYTYGNLTLHPAGQIVYKNGELIQLSETETKLLLALMKRPNQAIAKTRLFQEVWGHSDYDENSLNVYINHLRKKIEDNPHAPRYIITVWGVGYLFAGDALWA